MFERVATLALCLMTPCVQAAEVVDDAATHSNPLLETVTVTGTRLTVQPAQMSAHITVIDEQMLSRLNKGSLTDVLRAIPGLQVNQQGGPGGITNVYVRGGESNFSIVMIDGVQVNDPTNSRGGSFDFSSMQVDSIERIEVVRGPQSAIYGADALAGVINIVTRAGSRDVRNTFTSGIGTDGYHHLGYQLTGSQREAWEYAVGIYHQDQGHPVAGSSKELTTFTGKSVYRHNDTRAEGGIYFATSERESFPEDSGGSRFAVSRLLDGASSDDLALHAAVDQQFTGAWLSRVAGSWYRREDQTDSPGIDPFFEVPPNFSDIDFQRTQFSWVNVLELGSSVSASVGADVESERGVSDGYLDFFSTRLPTSFALDRKTYGVFAEVQGELTSGASVNWSIRRDDPDTASAETTQKIGVRYSISNWGTTFTANWGEGFKLPSFFALGHALVGNPDLKPERSRSYDLGITQRIASGTAVGLTLFRNDFQDLIDFDPELFTNLNRGQVRTQGAELRLDYSTHPTLQIAAFATYLDIDVAQAGVKLRGRPPWNVGLQTLWEMRPEVHVNVDYQWVDHFYEVSRHTGAAVMSSLDPYHRVDVNLSWQYSPHLELQLAVDNALNERYSEAVGFPAPGIRPRFSFRYLL